MVGIVVALAPEARPLIRRYDLRAVEAPFRLYRGEGVELIVSGTGKSAAAAATAYLQGLLGRSSSAWLNVGIAGSGRRTLGEGFLAHKIVDRASDRAWYPPRILDLDCRSATLVTVDRVEETFSEDVLYDMEAAGFYPTATRFSTSELVQCYKVISDSRSSPPRQVTRHLVSDLVEAKIEEIGAIVQNLEELHRSVERWRGDPASAASLIAGRHFTTSERRELRSLLRRWRALAPEREISAERLAHLASAGEILRFLRSELASLPVRVGEGVES